MMSATYFSVVTLATKYDTCVWREKRQMWQNVNNRAFMREFFVPFLQLFSRVEKNFFSKVKNKIKQKQMFLFFGPSELTANRQTRYCSMPGLYMNSFTPHNQGEVGIMMIPVSHRNCGALAPTAQSGSGLGFSDGTMVPTSYVST